MTPILLPINCIAQNRDITVPGQALLCLSIVGRTHHVFNKPVFFLYKIYHGIDASYTVAHTHTPDTYAMLHFV